MEKIWVVEEFTCYDRMRGGTTKTSEGFYTTKEKALAAVYNDIADALIKDDMHEPNVVQQDYTDTNIRIFVNCGELYGTYDWYYVISEVNVDLDYYRYRDFKEED